MGHSITALIVAEQFDEAAATEWDVAGTPIGQGLRLIHINAAYAAYQQHQRGAGTILGAPDDFDSRFPREGVLADLAAAVTTRTPPTFALIMTDYFGGEGRQWATAWIDGGRVPEVRDINGALQVLGVHATKGMDEFDTVGLSRHRSTPDALERYWDLCDDLGI
ncbi:hypothetical protein [Actinoplanes derwentensis]|uniref:Uncharacterized protein n=1 Tax=Actinoplanes derwentensis TaxID=113562 RepID=A0A1H1ZL41_9ACTN|nr:hypothetical protein [Actinoplanes derwentensis]GID82487.1 hypothetical protein Ade03nite_14110 [Actinoplanes derwentensis]SDT34152.1 hypothetical protein SAMN04489716_3367 [Actinoplanes derwentensis]